jgi:hypothetical protein
MTAFLCLLLLQFELADVWCEQVNGYKYADLLQQTLRDAKKSGLMEK